MQWSKLKSRIERFFAASVSGRVEVRTTSYRHAHDWEGRGWITLDGEKIGNICTRKYWVERSRLEFRCAQEKLGFARDIRSVGEAAG